MTRKRRSGTARKDDMADRGYRFRPVDGDRDLGPARAGRAHAGDLGKYRQRGFDRIDRPAAIPIAARFRLSPPNSIARSTPRSLRSARSCPITSASASSTSRAIRRRTQNGNVKYPNVNPLVEMTDMRDAQRSYEANLNIISATRRMIQRTLDILKA